MKLFGKKRAKKSTRLGGFSFSTSVENGDVFYCIERFPDDIVSITRVTQYKDYTVEIPFSIISAVYLNIQETRLRGFCE